MRIVSVLFYFYNLALYKDETLKKNIQQLNQWPYLLLIAAVFFWSVNFIVGRAVRADVPPVALAFFRWVGAATIITLFSWKHLRKDWSVILKYKGIILLLSFLGVTVFNTLIYMGLQTTIAINAFLLQSMIPVLIVGLSFVIFREKITGLQMLGILLSLTGAITIIGQGSLDVLKSLSLNRGDLLIFTAVFSYAGYSAFLRKRPPIHPLSLVSITFIVGLVILSPLYVWETIYVRPIELNLPAILSISYVAVFPSIISFICYNRGVEVIGANRAGLFIHLMPVFGSLMAILFLGETFRWFHAAGIGLIVSGIIMSTLIKKNRS